MIRLIKGALHKPWTVWVGFVAILFFSWLTIRSMKVDIFPKMGLPTIYVAQPYGGLSPEQVEGFVTSYYEYHFLYVTGVKYVESRSVQGAVILKIEFNEGTDMSQAMGEVVGYVNRSRAFMPPGTVPPFVTRFDAGSVAVGQLVFTSETRSLSEIQDLALFKVRPMFGTLPGVSAPPPFGGNQKTVIIKVDPEKMQGYGISPDEVVDAIAKFNVITPAGNLRAGDEMLIAAQNAVVENIKDLEQVPVRQAAGSPVMVRDIAEVQLGADVTTGYALINGKRSVYIPVTKRSDAATWDVVKRVKAALPDMQAAVPEDIKVTYAFDQSGYVINSLKSLSTEGLLGALLTGLMVLLFLRDLRGAFIVVITIPLALLSAIIGLSLFGQTLNIMTLGGLALAIGILVDESTVTIENIHHHQEMGTPKALAIWEACKEIALPKLLILLCVLAVFVPAFFMTGIPGAMFLPLSLAVGLAMIASFLLSQTLVPVFANYFLPERAHKPAGAFERFKKRYENFAVNLNRFRFPVALVYFAAAIIIIILFYNVLGRELFPKTDAGQAQVRLRLPTGTRLERTEDATRRFLEIADSLSGQQMEITSAFAGTQPSSYPVNLIHLWTSGPHEAVVKLKLQKGSEVVLENFKENLRMIVSKEMPSLKLSFEPGDLVEQVLNLGTTNLVEVAVQGKNLDQGRAIANSLLAKMKDIRFLRDVQISTPLDYPGIKMEIDRMKLGQLGLSLQDVSKSTVAATSSSRFTQPNYWLDRNTGTAYQVQVEYPQFRMNNAEALGLIPVANKEGKVVMLRDVTRITPSKTPGEYHRINQQRIITMTANVSGKDPGAAFVAINKAIASLDSLPAGVKVYLRGQAPLLEQTLFELGNGLWIAVVVILLMLTIQFQSARLAFIVVSTIPGVLAGSLGLLWLTGHTLNIQSYMGTIMAVGVAVANAILLVTNGEILRRQGLPVVWGLAAASNRLRPILMTSLAMMAGMLPMAIGMGEGGDQTAPLGVAVIGGLLFSTMATLLVLPMVYTLAVGKKVYKSSSLFPDADVHDLNA